MKGRHILMRAALVFSLAVGGCAAIMKGEAERTGRLLAAAGFHMSLADTPAKLAHLKTFTQGRLVQQQRKGHVHYVYADSLACKCVYEGTESDYRRYQRLAARERKTEGLTRAIEEHQEAALDREMY